MTRLLGPDGNPISHAEFKKADTPPMGPAFGYWTEQEYSSLFSSPGSAILGFDVSSLTIEDFRAMTYHPQVNASLSVLTFILHQTDWQIECKDKKIADQVERNLRDIWTRLIRGLSQSFWCGYAPCVLEFENNTQEDELGIVINKVKDLRPETCAVHWKIVEAEETPPNPDDGAISIGGPPFRDPLNLQDINIPGGGSSRDTTKIKKRFKVYNGIDQMGFGWIPPENTLWYPLLMQNGDYTGKKLLQSCYMPWYFSILMHLFANRYYERFGEPVPIGRAPFDDEVQIDGETVSGKVAMQRILTSLRNRSTVTLPSELDPLTKTPMWDVQYLESQMRGTDFESYLTRLDEEISLGLFTPLLMLKNSPVGSQNLGIQHTQTWLWQVNALASDLGEYITRYITERLKAINFSPNAPLCKWVPNKLGRDSIETTRAVITELIRGDKAKIDLEDLGQALGMKVSEVRQITQPNAVGQPVQPGQQTPGQINGQDVRTRTERVRTVNGPQRVGETRQTARAIAARIRPQIVNAFKNNTFGKDLAIDMGYNKRFLEALQADGFSLSDTELFCDRFYSEMDGWFARTLPLGKSEFESHRDYMSLLERKMDSLIDELVD
jgi:hypothetical protein